MAWGSYGYMSLGVLHTFRLPAGEEREQDGQSDMGVKLQARLFGQ